MLDLYIFKIYHCDCDLGDSKSFKKYLIGSSNLSLKVKAISLYYKVTS